MWYMHQEKKEQFPLLPFGNLSSFFPDEDPGRLFPFGLGLWAMLQQSTKPPESSSFPSLFKAAFLVSEYLTLSVLFIYYYVTNYPKIQPLKTTSRYYVAEFLRSANPGAANLGGLAQALSQACSQAINLTGAGRFTSTRTHVTVVRRPKFLATRVFPSGYLPHGSWLPPSKWFKTESH